MTISELINDFPLAGKKFAFWFANTYQLKEDIYNEAPLKHQIIALYKFMGYETSLDKEISADKHKDLLIERLSFYNKVLEVSNNDIRFGKDLLYMDRDIAINMFEAGKNTEKYRYTLKDALGANQNVKMNQNTTNQDKVAEITDNEDFWANITNDDVPF